MVAGAESGEILESVGTAEGPRLYVMHIDPTLAVATLPVGVNVGAATLIAEVDRVADSRRNFSSQGESRGFWCGFLVGIRGFRFAGLDPLSFLHRIFLLQIDLPHRKQGFPDRNRLTRSLGFQILNAF